MQIDDTDEESEIQSQEITFEDTIVNIDYAISKLRHNSDNNRVTQPNTNPWPETSYIYRERAVLSSQLWLHNIEFIGATRTKEILQQYYKDCTRIEIGNQIITYFNFDLKLNILIKGKIHWINNKLYTIFNSINNSDKSFNYWNNHCTRQQTHTNYLILKLYQLGNSEHFIKIQIVNIGDIIKKHKKYKGVSTFNFITITIYLKRLITELKSVSY